MVRLVYINWKMTVISGIRSLLRRIRTALGNSVGLLAAIACAIAGKRLLVLTHADRIGHLVGEIDCVLKEERLGIALPQKGLVLLPRDRVANRHVVKYWARYLSPIQSPLLCRLLELACRYRFVRFREDMTRYFSAIGETATYNDIYSRWGERPPLLELDDFDMRRGEETLRSLGLPPGARFVCFHSRDGGYSPKDEHLHSYRNASIRSYLPAMSAMRERGFFGVRMGDPTMAPMPVTEGVVDYAHSPLRSDWMDVFLCARCEFFLGNTSGLYLLSIVFGRPTALANLVPMSTALVGGPRELGIPKLLWNERERRHLRFAEIFSSPVANYRFTEQYVAAGIRTPENKPEDVRALALEMLDRCQGIARYDSEDDIQQAKFRALFRPGHYGYGSSAKIGRDFLRRYADLLN